ncbi:hypothetical protein [Dermabacter jinjuensis]|uniref:Uncharacterized protein n=1 Tax=Dermabacter jinjuensis TaxID=1667168 RepID=A0ABM6PKF6_9MICO|nr:hypothetical protein [Dermabacter jinjuensis]ATH95880.1 hypothetical protein COP05_01305 [Dermabacter jinjuensis]UEB89938.1 hypothetical protein LK448_00035 [Dermabacter jinjuensis]
MVNRDLLEKRAELTTIAKRLGANRRELRRIYTDISSTKRPLFTALTIDERTAIASELLIIDKHLGYIFQDLRGLLAELPERFPP